MQVDIRRDVPEDQQTWRSQLVLVSSLPTRFVGILSPEDRVNAEAGRPFVLRKAAVYFCNLALQQTQQGISIQTVPHALLQYDLMSTLEEVTVVRVEHIISV